MRTVHRFAKLYKADMEQCDLLIVLGTSLKVAPVSALPSRVGWKCPRVLINRELVGDFETASYRDVCLMGDCDDGAQHMASLLGWGHELKQLVDDYQQSSFGPARLKRMLDAECTCSTCSMLTETIIDNKK